MSKTSKTSSSSASSSSSSSNHEEDSDHPQSAIPVKSDHPQSNFPVKSDRAPSAIPVKSDRAPSTSENDHPRDTSAAAIMCAALLELGNILESMSKQSEQQQQIQQQQQQQQERRHLDTSTNKKLDSTTTSSTSNSNKAVETSSKTVTPSSTSSESSSSSSLLGSSQEYISYALAQLHSLSSPTYRTFPSSSRQLIRVNSKNHPLTTPSTELLTMMAMANVTIQDNKDGCYFLCEEFFLLKHGTGHFPHHR